MSATFLRLFFNEKTIQKPVISCQPAIKNRNCLERKIRDSINLLKALKEITKKKK